MVILMPTLMLSHCLQIWSDFLAMCASLVPLNRTDPLRYSGQWLGPRQALSELSKTHAPLASLIALRTGAEHKAKLMAIMALSAVCRSASISLAGLAALGTSMAQAPIVSPEVHPDHTVTFRCLAPNAKKVQFGLEGGDAVDMTKESRGIWSYTTPALVPDIYGYTFNVDGATVLDPNNPLLKSNLIWQSNMVVVPGTPPLEWEVQDVPHGSLSHHFYKSGVIGDQRDYFVYTPPGYSPTSRTKYPVLYLLHGYSDMANGWSAVGKSNVIMDNLIAQGKAKPMLVVMTLGYGVPDFASPQGSGFRNRGTVKQNYDNYMKALLTEVIPAVQSEYRVSSNRTERAIAGLSMGGAESMYVGMNNLDTFSYIGAFSSGGLSNNFDENFPGLDAANVNRKLKQLWISCGTEDGLIAFNREMVKWLQGKKVKLTAVETPGRHTWMVWRRDLISFAPLLFR